MAKNRKHQSAAIRFGPALKAFLLCLLIGGSGVGYVWQKNQIYDLGQQIRKREIHLKDLQDQNEKLRRQMAFMRSPPFLEARIKELNLGLVPPQPSQVWYLKEPATESSRTQRELAARQGVPVAMNE
ncbi:MAG TPA: hypothetical protein VH597_17115 [Verrucomicrobiae bacterium]|jgi:hypothetical protein|nr:hypothetical protein [Verrucomicrobiae bacterium]